MATIKQPRQRRPDQLTGGPHGMSREQVEANQSGRILAAMSELVAEHGYERTTVERVIERAGVSRRTFYELRGGRELWFLVICDAAATRLLARIATARAAGGRSPEWPARAAGALVDFCLDDPLGARICFVETLAANDEARAWRRTLIDRVTATIATVGDAYGADLVAEGEPGGGEGAAGRGDACELAARAAVGAVLELAGQRPEQLDRAYATALVAATLAAGERGGARE